MREVAERYFGGLIDRRNARGLPPEADRVEMNAVVGDGADADAA